MKPFKRILVPVDFSVHSDEAVATAADLCRRYEGSLTLMHVLEMPNMVVPYGYLEYTPAQFADLSGSVDRLLLAKKADAEAAGAASAQMLRLRGTPAIEITNYAREHGFDLIVMGTHGRTGIAHAVMGSVAEKVLRNGVCPVLTVRAQQRAA